MHFCRDYLVFKTSQLLFPVCSLTSNLFDGCDYSKQNSNRTETQGHVCVQMNSRSVCSFSFVIISIMLPILYYSTPVGSPILMRYIIIQNIELVRGFQTQSLLSPSFSFGSSNFICVYNICLAHNSQQAIKTLLIIGALGFLCICFEV